MYMQHPEHSVVRLRRFERRAYSSGGCRSIQLSYKRTGIVTATETVCLFGRELSIKTLFHQKRRASSA